MQKFLILFVYLFCSACTEEKSLIPEEFLLQTLPLSQRDLNTVSSSGFDLYSFAPDGRTYVESLLERPEKIVEMNLLSLLQRHTFKTQWIDQHGRNILNYVLSNPSDFSLPMAKMLLSSSYRTELLKSPYNPLLDVLDNKKISANFKVTCIQYLLSQGFSFNTIDPKTQKSPVFEFMRYGSDFDLKDLNELLTHMNLLLEDKDKNNVWSFLFANQNKDIIVLTALLLKNPNVKKLLTHSNRGGVFPINILCSNAGASAFQVYATIISEYEEFFTHSEWINKLFLSILSNSGPCLQPLFKEIVHYKPNVNFKNENGDNSLLIATQNKNPFIVFIIRYLLAQKVNIYSLNNQDYNALTYTVLNPCDFALQILSLLQQKGIVFNLPDKDGRTLVSYVVENEGASSTKILDFLLKQGVSLTKKDNTGLIPLKILVHNHSLYSIKMLRQILYSGYQGRFNDVDSADILFDVASSESPYAYKMMLTLIQYGFSFTTQNSKQQNVLFFVVKNKGPCAVRMLRLLIAKGLSPNVIDIDINSPLIYALQNTVYGYTMVDILLSKGGDPLRQNTQGDSMVGLVSKMDQARQQRFQVILDKYKDIDVD